MEFFAGAAKGKLMAKKRTLWGILLGLALLLGMVLAPTGTAQARGRYKDCRERIEHQKQKLHRVVRRFGVRSRQAVKAREKLRDIRAKCDGRR